jgi:transposase
MDNEHIEYILMLRTTFREYDRLAELAIDKIRSYKNEIRNSWNEERYGLTTECILYKDGPSCYAQILWSAERYQNKRNGVKQIVESERSRLQAFIDENKGKSLIQSEIKDLPFYFKLKTEAGEPRIVEKKKRGRGGGTEQKEINTVRITGYEDDETAINRLYQKAGITIIMTSAKMTAQETNDYYSKRDCVEKTFQALKSHLGMDKIGVTTEEAMHGKGLVWFVASILHAILFNKTSALRTTERKCFTVPAMIDQLEAIKADKNLSTGKRERRYKLTSKQKQILNFWDLDEVQIDQKIASISE